MALFKVSTYGATGNGTTDDTMAIQACMNDAANAGGTVYVDKTSAFYKVSSPLFLKTSIVADSMPVIKTSGGTGLGDHQIVQVKIQNLSQYVKDITIDGLWLQGGWNSPYGYSSFVYNVNEYDHGIAVQGVSNLTIRNCRIQDTIGDCINIGRTTVSSIENTPTRILVEDCQFVNPWRNALQTGFNTDLTIRRCRVEKPGNYNFGFDIESDRNYPNGSDPNTGVNSGDISGIVIEDCDFTGTGIDLTSGYPVPANAPFLQISNHNATADIINVRISDNTINTSTLSIGITGGQYNVPPFTTRAFVNNLVIERNQFVGKQSISPKTWTSSAGPLPDDFTMRVKYTRGPVSIADNVDTNDSLYGWHLMGMTTGARIAGNTIMPQSGRRQVGITLDSGSSGDGGVGNQNGPCLVSGNRFCNVNSPVVATPPSGFSPGTPLSVSAAIRLTGNNGAICANHAVLSNAFTGCLHPIVVDAPVVQNILTAGNFGAGPGT